jgi:hypothetical protein
MVDDVFGGQMHLLGYQICDDTIAMLASKKKQFFAYIPSLFL